MSLRIANPPNIWYAQVSLKVDNWLSKWINVWLDGSQKGSGPRNLRLKFHYRKCLEPKIDYLSGILEAQFISNHSPCAHYLCRFKVGNVIDATCSYGSLVENRNQIVLECEIYSDLWPQLCKECQTDLIDWQSVFALSKRPKGHPCHSFCGTTWHQKRPITPI